MATGRLPDPNTAPITSKGDLYTYSTVPARLAVGPDGDTLVADSAASTGLRWQANWAAGKNKIINGDFNIWQRGTSFTNPNFVYTADRWLVTGDGTGTRTISRQAFTPGTAPVAGYEGSFFFRYNRATAGTGGTYAFFSTRLEDVRTLAGQTATLSFWAKADAARTITPGIGQNFGSGGSATVDTAGSSINLTTSWVRYSQTFNLPSVSGKTIGTSSYLDIYWGLPNNVAMDIDIWGVQIEAGNVATAFQTATGTLQGELAACQRYYEVMNFVSGTMISTAQAQSTTAAYAPFYWKVTKRGTPTLSVPTGGLNFLTANGSGAGATASFTNISVDQARIDGTGATLNFVAGNASSVQASAATTIAISAEL